MNNGTSCTIAVQHLNNTVSQVKCRLDGYLRWAGITLLTHYDTIHRIEYLIANGSFRSLTVHEDDVEYSFEDSALPKVFDNLDDYFANRDSSGYNYLYTEHEDDYGNRFDMWLVSTESTSKFSSLAKELNVSTGSATINKITRVKKNSVARNIVANLGRRYRFAKKMRKKIELNVRLNGDDWGISVIPGEALALEQESEAWNAFESSRRILNGFDL